MIRLHFGYVGSWKHVQYIVFEKDGEARHHNDQLGIVQCLTLKYNVLIEPVCFQNQICCQRWSRFPEQNGGLAKMDSGFDYAANFSWFACVA